MIYTTHYMEEAERLCDRVAIIDKGKLLALGTVRRAARRARRQADAGGADRRRRAIASRPPIRSPSSIAWPPAAVTSFHMERATLEQVFLHLTGRSLRD